MVENKIGFMQNIGDLSFQKINDTDFKFSIKVDKAFCGLRHIKQREAILAKFLLSVKGILITGCYFYNFAFCAYQLNGLAAK